MYRVLRHFVNRGVKYTRGDLVTDDTFASPAKLVRARMLEPVAKAYKVVKHVADLRTGEVYKAEEAEAWPSFRSLVVNGYIEPTTTKPKKPASKIPEVHCCSLCEKAFASDRALKIHFAQAHR